MDSHYKMANANRLWDYRVFKTYTMQLFPVTVSETLADQSQATSIEGDPLTPLHDFAVPQGRRHKMTGCSTINTSTNPLRGLMPLLILCALMLYGLNAQASTLAVSSTNDSGAGTLRDQVAAAASGDTINFSVTALSRLRTARSRSTRTWPSLGRARAA